jgi:hypothetical protein
MRYEAIRAIVDSIGQILREPRRRDVDVTDKKEQGCSMLLVALELRSYSQVIGKAIASLRPALSVRIVDPENLLTETERLRPRLVLSSHKKHLIAPAAPDWIEYHFTDEEVPIVLVNGQREETPVRDLDDLLALIDRTLAASEDAECSRRSWAS